MMRQDSSELPGARKHFPSVRQRAPAWCIPAGLEVILSYAGIEGVSQDALVLDYCRRHGDDALISLASRRPVLIDGLNDSQVLGLACLAGFRQGDFGSFSAATDALVNLKAQGFDLYHPPQDPIQCEEHLKSAISAGFACLMAGENGNGDFHIYVPLAYRGSQLSVYEPWSGTIEEGTLSTFQSNGDCLILRAIK